MVPRIARCINCNLQHWTKYSKEFFYERIIDQVQWRTFECNTQVLCQFLCENVLPYFMCTISSCEQGDDVLLAQFEFFNFNNELVVFKTHLEMTLISIHLVFIESMIIKRVNQVNKFKGYLKATHSMVLLIISFQYVLTLHKDKTSLRQMEVVLVQLQGYHKK